MRGVCALREALSLSQVQKALNQWNASGGDPGGWICSLPPGFFPCLLSVDVLSAHKLPPFISLGTWKGPHCPELGDENSPGNQDSLLGKMDKPHGWNISHILLDLC